MAVKHGKAVCWGVDERWTTLPVINLPDGIVNIRWRMRNTDPVTVFIKTETETQRWLIGPVGGTFKDVRELELICLLGVNKWQ